MNSTLPATGTAQLLKLLSPYIPDSFINQLVPRHRGRGRRQQLNSAQLYRLHLLSVLTPVHAFNHLVRLLAEQRDWRRFAHLSNRQAVPDVWMLNQFRERCGVSGLRRINEQLLTPMLPQSTVANPALALIDATDLEASCSGHKKSRPDNTAQHAALGVGGRSNAEPVLCRVQEAHLSALAASVVNGGVLLVPLVSWVAPRQLRRRRIPRPSVICSPPACWQVSSPDRGRYGQH